MEFLIALDAAHARLRQIADPDDPPDDLIVRARRAFGEVGVYEAREKLLLSANPAVVVPAEEALRRLATLRGVVRDGAKLHTMPYHDAYHPYAEALWKLRSSIRVDLGSAALTASVISRALARTRSQSTCMIRNCNFPSCVWPIRKPSLFEVRLLE